MSTDLHPLLRRLEAKNPTMRQSISTFLLEARHRDHPAVIRRGYANRIIGYLVALLDGGVISTPEYLDAIDALDAIQEQITKDRLEGAIS